MSTKDLSRSVMEGGRYRFSRWLRRESHRVARAQEKRVAQAVRRDPDAEDDRAWPERAQVARAFFDRLSAPERWLESQVGRSWNRVRSEMLALFDTRTLAGRHIVFDHLLPEQRSYEDLGVWRVVRVRFRIDERGILRRLPPEVWPRSPRPFDRVETDALCAFVGTRRLIARGTRVYWLVPIVRDEGVRYRQDRALSRDELARWAAFSEAVQRLALLVDPTDVTPARASADRREPPTAPHRGCRSAR